MNSDRELLEFAAKAASIKILEYRERDDSLELRCFIGEQKQCNYWNPLEYDDDAFRLLVSLNLSVQCPGGMVFTDAYHVQSPDPVHVAVEVVSDDPAKSLRRAIVRVAAELGREMQP